MDTIEQLQAEAAERAGSPEGVLLLIRLLLREADDIDWRSSDAPRKYFLLLRAYVLAKRQLSHLDKAEDPYTGYMATHPFSSVSDICRELRETIKERRKEARAFASQWIPQHRLKALKQYAGVHMACATNEIDTSYLGAFAHGRNSMPSEAGTRYRRAMRESGFARLSTVEDEGKFIAMREVARQRLIGR